MTLLAALVLLTPSSESPDAWRALLEIPISPEPVGIDLAAMAHEQAASRMTVLAPQLLREKREPRILLRAAEWMEVMGDPIALDYAERARVALAGSTSTPEVDAQLAEALIRLNRNDEAVVQLAKLANGPVRWRWEGERLRRQVEAEAQVKLVPREISRWLPLSLASLRRPESGIRWQALLNTAVESFEKAVKAEPKDPVLHRLSADAMVARAYVDSAERWLKERKTVSLIPVEAFVRFKEAAALASEDPLAQAEAYEVRVLRETEQLGANVGKWPKDAAKYLEGLRAQLIGVAGGTDSVSARQASEILALLAVREGRLDEGLKWLDRANDPPSERMSWVRFRVWLGTGRLAEAITEGEALLPKLALSELAFGLAAAYDRVNRPEDRDRVLLDARQHEPEHLGLMLAQAIVSLRQPDGSGLSSAGVLLDNAEARGADDLLVHEIRFARVVYYALLGDVPAARATLAKITAPLGTRVTRARKLLEQ